MIFPFLPSPPSPAPPRPPPHLIESNCDPPGLFQRTYISHSCLLTPLTPQSSALRVSRVAGVRVVCVPCISPRPASAPPTAALNLLSTAPWEALPVAGCWLLRPPMPALMNFQQRGRGARERIEGLGGWGSTELHRSAPHQQRSSSSRSGIERITKPA